MTLFHESTDRIALIARRVKLPRPPLIDGSARVLAGTSEPKRDTDSKGERWEEDGGRGLSGVRRVHVCTSLRVCQVFSARFTSLRTGCASPPPENKRNLPYGYVEANVLAFLFDFGTRTFLCRRYCTIAKTMKATIKLPFRVARARRYGCRDNACIA